MILITILFISISIIYANIFLQYSTNVFLCNAFIFPLVSIDTLIQYLFIDLLMHVEKKRLDVVMELQEIYIQDFGLIFQTVSSMVRKKEHHLFTMICVRKNGKQLEKY